MRQLESAIERAILLAENDKITLEDLPTEVRQEVGPAAEGTFKLPAEGINFEDVERNLITQAMEQTDYNITKAAKLLGLTFRTLQYRLEKFGIKRPDGHEASDGAAGRLATFAPACAAYSANARTIRTWMKTRGVTFFLYARVPPRPERRWETAVARPWTGAATSKAKPVPQSAAPAGSGPTRVAGARLENP